MLSAVEYIQLINAVFDKLGFKDFINPNNPETNGEAIDVPLIVAYVLFGTVLKILLPGAVMSTLFP